MPNIQVTDCLHQQLLSDQLVQGTVGLQHFWVAKMRDSAATERYYKP